MSGNEVVSNIRPDDIPEPRLRSRFLDTGVCQVVPNSGPDLRLRKPRLGEYMLAVPLCLHQEAPLGIWIAAGELLPFSVTLLYVAEGEARTPKTGLMVTSTLLENDHLRVELNEAGDIIRIYDKANRREVLPAGAIANQFQAFEDRPIDSDAWDVDIFFDDKMWTADPATLVQVVEAGPLRATLEDLAQRVEGLGTEVGNRE